MKTLKEKIDDWKNHKFWLSIYYLISITTFAYFFVASLLPFIMMRVSESWIFSLFYFINWLVPIILAACWADTKLSLLYSKLLEVDK